MCKSNPPIPMDPLVTTVNMIGDSYTFLITREAFFGATRFEDFAARLNISRARLSERLKHLVTLGVFEKKIYAPSSGRSGYALTKKGLSLYQIALTMLAWGDEWRPQQNCTILHHRLCGAPLAQKTICCSCEQEVSYKDVIWPQAPLLKPPTTGSNNVKGWRKTGVLTNVSGRISSTAQTLEAVGDRWSILIMYLALHGPFRFNHARDSLGVADNILSKRLQHLMGQKLLKREAKSGKQIYVATRSGIALLPVVLTQRMWADEWESRTKNQWSELRHSTCGNILKTKCICTTCKHSIFPGDVEIRKAQ